MLDHLSCLLPLVSQGAFPDTCNWVANTALVASGVSVFLFVAMVFLNPVERSVPRGRCRALGYTTGVLAGLVLFAQTIALVSVRFVTLWRGAEAADGWWSASWASMSACVLLLVAVGFAQRGSRDLRLFAVAFVAGLLTVTQAVFAGDAPVEASQARWLFSLWTVSLVVVLGAFVLVQGWSETRRRYRRMWENPAALAAPPATWPGFVAVAESLGALLIVLFAFELAWPVSWFWGGYRTASLLFAVGGLVGSASFFALANRIWSVSLADFGALLLTFACVGFVGTFLPGQPAALVARMPVHFNAVVFALAVMAGFWVWIARVWAQQLDAGQPWTTAGRLLPLTPRFALFVGGLGVFVALLMSAWPRFPGVGQQDASFGRMVSGVAGHLLLLLVLLNGGRRFRRWEFYLLAGAATASLIAFLVVRTADFVTVVR